MQYYSFSLAFDDEIVLISPSVVSNSHMVTWLLSKTDIYMKYSDAIECSVYINHAKSKAYRILFSVEFQIAFVGFRMMCQCKSFSLRALVEFLRQNSMEIDSNQNKYNRHLDI